MADPIIAVGGENLIDQVTTDATTVSHPGGSPFNVARAAALQGARVAYISPISTDRWGDMLADRLTDAGVALTGGRNDRPTTMARVVVEKGIPEYSFEREGTAERAVDAAFLTEQVFREASALHTGSLALIDGEDADAWEETLSRAYDRGLLVSVDPNVRMSLISNPKAYRDRIMRIVGKAHLLKLSDEDLTGLFGPLDEAEALAQLRTKTPASLVVLTRGPQGVSAWLGDTRLDLPAPRPDPLVDTVGAGDTFMATLLATLAARGYLAPDPLAKITPQVARSILSRAAQAAALNCERAGCNPPTKADLDAAGPIT